MKRQDEKLDMSVEKYLKPYTKRQIENWSNSNKIEIYKDETQLLEFVKNAQTDKTSNKKMYFGIIPTELAERVKKNFQVDIEGHNCVLRADEIRKIVKSHGQISKEADRGQRVVTDIDFGYIPEVIGNPELIENGGMYFNKPVLKFTRGRRTVVTVVSKKHLDVFTQTMYIREKEKSLATTPGDKDIRPHTSETLSGTASNDSIAKK